MNEQSEKWDAQWRRLLTHCYGEVEADAGFKADLLAKLKAKTAVNHSPENGTDDARTDEARDENWGRLLTAAYVPCEPSPEFQGTLLSQLKARQTQLANPDRTEAEDEALQTILTKSYHPVTPRREFQTRLLENLKERQRSHTTIRMQARRRTLFLSSAAGMAAAAAIMFAVWVMPTTPAESKPEHRFLALQIPETAESGDVESRSFASSNAYADIVPASHTIAPAATFASYNVETAFAVAALPAVALARKNIEYNDGGGWKPLDGSHPATLSPGMAFRSTGDQVGYIGFDNDALITINNDAVVVATEDGMSVRQGFAVVSFPETATGRFRLHFPERDIALEPGTDLAIMVQPEDNYASGGAPAPTVMVLQEPGSVGGLALARGKNGVAPLFARHLYRLDNYVTPEIPGRPLCEIECEDLNKMYNSEGTIPMAAFAGGLAKDRMQLTQTRVINPVGFNRKSDRWVADSYANQPTVKIKYLSDEYFGLANQRRDLARGLALGANVIVDGGDGVFYEIIK